MDHLLLQPHARPGDGGPAHGGMEDPEKGGHVFRTTAPAREVVETPRAAISRFPTSWRTVRPGCRPTKTVS